MIFIYNRIAILLLGKTFLAEWNFCGLCHIGKGGCIAGWHILQDGACPVGAAGGFGAGTWEGDWENCQEGTLWPRGVLMASVAKCFTAVSREIREAGTGSRLVRGGLRFGFSYPSAHFGTWWPPFSALVVGGPFANCRTREIRRPTANLNLGPRKLDSHRLGV